MLEQFGNHHAVELPDGQMLSYAELAALADQAVATLGSGRKLCFLLVNNTIESLAVYLGCLRANHVALLLPENIDQALLALLQESYEPNATWQKSIGWVNRHSYPVPMHADLKLLLSTSGSTGSPKLVRLSANNLHSNAESIVEYLQLTANEKAITVLPMNYTYGLSVINSHLAAGATLLLTELTIIQREFWDFFTRANGTSLVGVPYTYSIYRRIGVFKRMHLPSLRYMTQAGGKLPADEVAEVATWCQEHQVRFYVMYGQTEATARMSYLPPEQTLIKNASVGIAIPGGRFAIEDDNHYELSSPGIDGELIYYGPNVSLGYAEKQSDLLVGDLNQGRLATGDLARYDCDGYVYITGRLKRFIKITGNRIGLDEIENRLKQIGLDAICGGKDDLLCVALVSGDVDQTSEILQREFKLHHSMIKVIAVESIPRNEAGKIRYEEVFKGMY